MAVDKRFECPDCGKMVLSLFNHGCSGGKIKATVWQETKAETKKPKPPLLLNPKPAVNRPKKRELPSTERTARWREANREKAREYQRNYMKKWRAQPNGE